MKICSPLVRYVCLDCGATSVRIDACSLNVADLYNESIQHHGRICYSCRSENVRIREIRAALEEAQCTQFDIAWECKACGAYWAEYVTLTAREYKRDKDIVIKLMRSTKCPGPDCTNKLYNLKRMCKVK